MSLRVWLPLNGDLHNQGVSNHTIALTNGNTWTSPGKIGNNALTLTKLQLIVPSTSCMSGAKEISYAYWIKVNTAWSNDWLDGIRWIETDGSATSTARQEFYTNCTLIGTWYKGGAIYGKAFTPGVWTHLAGTFNYNTGEAKFYINGVLSGSTTNINTAYYCRGDFCIGDNGVDICENDVRIYDHCLSAAEVREIAQGLVLHYKLDDITNDIEDSSGYNHCAKIVSGTLTTNIDTARYSCCTASSTPVEVKNDTSEIPIALTTHNSYSFSIWLKTNVTTSRWIYYMGDNSGGCRGLWITAAGKPQFAYNGSGTFTSDIVINDNQWHHICFTVKDATSKCYVDGIDYGGSTSTKTTVTASNNIRLIYNQKSEEGKTDNLSDFRIYCTTLSSNDILQLYHTSAKVDNKQKLHTFELVENQNKIAIDKQGRVLCKELTENTNTKFYKANQAIDTEQIIEF